jgi:hypothetical protein
MEKNEARNHEVQMAIDSSTWKSKAIIIPMCLISEKWGKCSAGLA